ncbi:histidine kinase [Leptolyngbya sp. 'hensonii']|nr:histidine kinase [Leptolyngbya sp. 'hensonii']
MTPDLPIHQQSALLRRVVDRIRNSLELRIVLQTAVDEVAALLQLDCCAFFWFSLDNRQLQVVCERILRLDRPSLLGVVSLEQLGCAATAVSQGHLVVNGHSFSPTLLESEPIFLSPGQEPQHLLSLGTATNLLIPVAGQGSSVGYIACLMDHPHAWSAVEIDFMQTIAQQLEIGIQQAQLYEKTQRQAQRETLVNQITTQTRQSFDLETILTQAIAHLMEGLEADRALVHLVEDIRTVKPTGQCSDKLMDSSLGLALQSRHLYEVCRQPFPPSIHDFDTHGPITQWVIQHGHSVVISDVEQDDRIGANNAEYQQAQIKSSLVVPVQTGGVLQAILYLNQCSHTRYWSADDLKLVQAVADQLAISIQQAHLYAKTQLQAAESAAQAQYLAETLRELRLTQAQLIQSEKLSSMGQMVAGVAHEINNPVSFIYGNLPYIQRYVQDLLRLLQAYEAQLPEPPLEIQKLMEDIEMEFLVEDLFGILNSMQVGTKRIREIVQSLRNFSRLDEADRKMVDLHEGLESTLAILQNHLHGEIRVERQYGHLPLVECYPRLLNQVFMNLLMNAIEALNRSLMADKVIIIRTHLLIDPETEEQQVQIAIADNGPGISPEIHARIFDPFFTTKDIGQGTGLGLAVSYQTIVNHHRGQFRVFSQAGEGAEFVIEIPVQYSKVMVRGKRLGLTMPASSG